ncbi:hypothetical protein FOMPIDRAFT_1096433, partial [Fomitopsis schrenkii]
RLRLLIPPLLATQRASWEQGVASHALLECHQFWERTRPPVSPPFDFNQTLYAFAHESVVRQAPDGRLGVLLNGDGTTDTGAADPASMGEVIYWVLAEQKRTEYRADQVLSSAVDKQFRYILADCPRGGNGLLSHWIDRKEIWSDTVYMLPPFLVSAALSRLSETSQYSMAACDILRYGLRQIVLAAEVLQAPSGEWSHIYDLDAGWFKREAQWGVGNGWVCCGIVRVLWMLVRASKSGADLPNILSRDAELAALVMQCYLILLSTLRACFTHMRSDGLFHDVLDDPTTFVETNLSQMLAFTVFRLALLGKQPSPLAEYMPAVPQEDLEEWLRKAETMRAAAVGKTDRWGLVRDVCGSPRFDKAGTAAEGQAWAVMMEIARAEW